MVFASRSFVTLTPFFAWHKQGAVKYHYASVCPPSHSPHSGPAVGERRVPTRVPVRVQRNHVVSQLCIPATHVQHSAAPCRTTRAIKQSLARHLPACCGHKGWLRSGPHNPISRMSSAWSLTCTPPADAHRNHYIQPRQWPLVTRNDHLPTLTLASEPATPIMLPAQVRVEQRAR